jgi:predicted CoA-binding protein
MTSTQIKSRRPQFLQGVESIAVAGVSRRRGKFGALAFRELKKRGYLVFPINPALEDFQGQPCYAGLSDVPETPDCVLVTVKPEFAGQIVEQAIARGVTKVWFQQGADFSEAAAKAARAGIEVVEGGCLLMYAEPVTGIHRLHRYIAKLFKKY